MNAGAIDAIVGMHTSQVRQRVLKDVARQIPYVYTPLYEGGERTPGVFALGETPGQQLRPAIEYLASRYAARRWMFVGNDYVWPRVSHRLAARYVGELGGEVVADRYLPFGAEDYSELLDEIARLKPHAILLSLVGQDAVQFNRAFGRCGLSRDMFRLSCAIEENGLLAIGADNTEGLFVSSGYFASLDNDANMAFKERYYNHFGQRAPTLNALGQSTYEGVHFMAALARRAADENAQLLGHLAAPLAFRSVRGIQYSATSAARTRPISPRPAATSSSARSPCRAGVTDSGSTEAARKLATAIVSSESNDVGRRSRAVVPPSQEGIP